MEVVETDRRCVLGSDNSVDDAKVTKTKRDPFEDINLPFCPDRCCFFSRGEKENICLACKKRMVSGDDQPDGMLMHG